MDLSKLNWVKVVTPPHDWRSRWAYTAEELKLMKNVINDNGVVIFPLGFRDSKANDPALGDLILLTQHAKVSHIVEVLDEQAAAQDNDWFIRYVKVVWWKADELSLESLPKRDQILGFDLNIRGSIPYKWESFETFCERWDEKRDEFLSHIVAELKRV
jgi:hypothetical protein